MGGAALGMTFVFNQSVRDAMKYAYDHDKRAWKDWYIKLYAAACGRIIYDQTSTVKYRRHGGAVTASSNSSSGTVKRYFEKFKELFNNDPSYVRGMLCFLRDNYQKSMSNKNYKLVSLFADSGRRFEKASYKGRFRVILSDEIVYRFLFLMGKL